MQKTNISTLKNRLSAYLKKVQAGETVLVLDRNRPIARIERVTGALAEDERIARLEDAGLISRPKRPLSRKLWAKRPPRAKKGLLEAVLEERREGR